MANKNKEAVAEAKTQIVKIGQFLGAVDKAKTTASKNALAATDIERFDMISDLAYERMLSIIQLSEGLASGKLEVTETEAIKNLHALTSDAQSQIINTWLELNAESDNFADSLIAQARTIKTSNRMLANDLEDIFSEFQDKHSDAEPKSDNKER